MVRLKDSYLYFVLNYVHISIPYGAIKSWKNFLEMIKKIEISIPYGAIKRGRLWLIVFYNVLDFNSLWCD